MKTQPIVVFETSFTYITNKECKLIPFFLVEIKNNSGFCNVVAGSGSDSATELFMLQHVRKLGKGGKPAQTFSLD